MNIQILKIVRPDMKGRIALGILTKGISSFAVIQEGDKIILIPYVEVLATLKSVIIQDIIP